MHDQRSYDLLKVLEREMGREIQAIPTKEKDEGEIEDVSGLVLCCLEDRALALAFCLASTCLTEEPCVARRLACNLIDPVLRVEHH